MFKNSKSTSLDYTNVITESYNEQAKALNTVDVSSLVPVRFGKVVLEYVLSGYGIGEVGVVKFYDDGVYQETRLSFRGDELGKAHKTTINFINKTPQSLAGKAIVIYDSLGPVKVWFNVDGANTTPLVDSTYRDIVVNILSSDNHETIATKTAIAVNADSAFLAVYSLYYVIVSHNVVGVLPDSYDFSAALAIKNTSGINPNTLNNKYFFLNSALDAESYYIWYNVNGAGVDPAIPLKTGIMVTIPSGASKQQVLQNTKVAIDLVDKFITNINNEDLLLCNQLIGSSTPASEENSGFVVFTTKLGNTRQLLVTLSLTYNASNELVSVERL